MLNEVSVSKRKGSAIVARVSNEMKEYVVESAKKLGVSETAYLLQLIKNDQDVLMVQLKLEPKIVAYLYEESKLKGISVSDLVNDLLRGIMNGD